MKRFCFTVDDNIRVLRELTESGCNSLFDHPYLSMYRRLHEKYALKVQLNLFYEMAGFDLSRMTDRYRTEWQANADWLKLSFHSKKENVNPYEQAGYKEVAADCQAVHREILRFAGKASLAKTTTIHYCRTTEEGLNALRDQGVLGLLGLYGTEENPRISYGVSEAEGNRIRRGEMLLCDGMAHGSIDLVLNLYGKEDALERLSHFTDRPLIKVMIHEQYFYPDYPRYQPDFEEKLSAVFDMLTSQGYTSVFFEACLE